MDLNEVVMERDATIDNLKEECNRTKAELEQLKNLLLSTAKEIDREAAHYYRKTNAERLADYRAFTLMYGLLDHAGLEEEYAEYLKADAL